MPIVILIPFSVFFLCCLLQFWFLKQVKNILIERYPEAYLSIEKSSFFPDQGLRRFMRGDRYKDLQDTELNKHVRNVKRLYLIAILAWLAFAFLLVTSPMH